MVESSNAFAAPTNNILLIRVLKSAKTYSPKSFDMVFYG